MHDHVVQDQKLLREEAYADATFLEIRYRTHQLYTVDPVDFGRWTLERLVWRGGERVLDMGCGPGTLLLEMARQHDHWGALAGFDPSPGMVRQAAQAGANLPVWFFLGDAQALPITDAWFDVVMARHMLYHVPDIDRAVAEGTRLLRPDGRFLAITNSANTMPELWDLVRRAADRFPSVVLARESPHRFTLENAEDILSPHLERIEVHLLPGMLRFPTAEPLVAYFASLRALTMRAGHTEREWRAVLDFVRKEAEAVIVRRGCLEVTKVTGALVGYKGD